MEVGDLLLQGTYLVSTVSVYLCWNIRCRLHVQGTKVPGRQRTGTGIPGRVLLRPRMDFKTPQSAARKGKRKNCQMFLTVSRAHAVAAKPQNLHPSKFCSSQIIVLAATGLPMTSLAALFQR